MILSEKHSAIGQFLKEAKGNDDLHSTTFYGEGSDRPKIIYLSDDLNEPKDTGFYSDRFPCWCSEEVKKSIHEKVGLSVYSFTIWRKLETAEKTIECYCKARKMMSENDKVVITSIIHLINKSNGCPYAYVTYRIDKNADSE